jgi:hypothetical protein
MTVITVAALCLITSAPAFGVIMHNDDEPTDRPHDDVIGRWSYNASCVAIAPNYIITTRHQGGGVGSSIVIGGNTYTAAEVWNHSSADLRIVRINASLANYVSLYTESDESGKDFVLGGFGKGRGDPLVTGGGVTYGYEWSGIDNQTQRWGTNHVDATQPGYSGGTSYSSDVLRADFDESGTAYEAALSEWDSGGGWFIKVGDEWQLAALSAYVEHNDETWFLNNISGLSDPDMFRSIRISSYDTWITETIPEPGTMILLTLGAVSLLRRRR